MSRGGFRCSPGENFPANSPFKKVNVQMVPEALRSLIGPGPPFRSIELFFGLFIIG